MQCILLVRTPSNTTCGSPLSLGTIEYMYIRLVRPQSKTLDFPILTEYNAVHTFSQTPVEKPRLCTLQCIFVVRPLSTSLDFPSLTELNTVHSILLVRPLLKSLDFPHSAYSTVHTFSQSPVEKSRLPYSEYNTVHTFSQNPVKKPRLPYSN